MPEYFTMDEFRALPDMADPNKYPDSRVEASAAHIVAIIERETGTSFVARTVTDEVYDGGRAGIVLRAGYVLSVASAKIGGTTVTDTLTLRDGVVYRGTGYNPTTWTPGTGNVTVTYQAGYSTTPPADVKEAALTATRAHLMETAADSSMDARRTSLNTDMGVIGYAVAGEGRPTGYPSVDEVIMGYKRRLDVLGFA